MNIDIFYEYRTYQKHRGEKLNKNHGIRSSLGQNPENETNTIQFFKTSQILKLLEESTNIIVIKLYKIKIVLKTIYLYCMKLINSLFLNVKENANVRSRIFFLCKNFKFNKNKNKNWTLVF